MKGAALTILLSLCCLTASAQLVIDGRPVVYDKLTGTLLATVRESDFGNNCSYSVKVENDWQMAVINAVVIIDSCLFDFHKISERKKLTVTMVTPDNQFKNYTLQFTFLPVIKLTGSFSNDYSEGCFQLVTPEDTLSDQLSAQIKWRGGITNADGKHKRNYKIKFNEDHRLLGLRNDNNWILDAGQLDPFRLRNLVAMEIWNDIATKPYYANREPKARTGIRGRVVELFLNDEYQGIYNFAENMDRKQMKLKKVDSQTKEVHGCLYKAKGWGYAAMWDTLTVNYDNRQENWNVFEVKYPDLNDNDTTDWSTLYNAIDFVVMSSDDDFKRYVADYFDIPPLIDYSVFLSVLNAADNAGKNLFWAVYDKAEDKKLTPAVWDLDCTVGQQWFGLLEDTYYSPDSLRDMNIRLTWRLAELNVDNFADRLNERYSELSATVFATDSLIGRYRHYYQQMDQSGAKEREERRWSGDSDILNHTLDMESEMNYIAEWIEHHIDVINQSVFPLPVKPVITDSSPQNQHPKSNTTYSLSGQRLNANVPLKPGIYIRNGRKIMVRR